VLKPFLAEYEGLYQALSKSHDQEAKLAKRMRDLNAEIVVNGGSVANALKYAQEEQQIIQQLRRDIETQQKQVEQSHSKERLNKDSITKLKMEIKELTEKIDQGATMTEEQQNLLDNLARSKEQLEKDRDLLKQNSEMLQNITAEQLEKMHEQDGNVLGSEENITVIKHKLSEKKTEVENEKQRKEHLEQQMKDLRYSNEQHTEEVNNSKRNVLNGESELRKVEEDITKAEKDEHEKEAKVRMKMEEKHKLEVKLEQELTKNNKYTQENEQRELALRAKREEIQGHKSSRTNVRSCTKP
jgi:chromosome segregation ATPase